MALLALCALLFCMTPAVALADPGPATPSSESSQEADFPWISEELYFSVRINGTEAMRAGLRTGTIRQREGHAYIPINGMARSRGFFNAVYPLDDRANTFLNPRDFRPLRSEKVFEEAGKKRSYFVDYRHNSFEAQVERTRENRTTQFNSPIPGRTHDMMTWIYDLRRVRTLSMGDQFSFYIYDGWLVSRLDLEVVGQEDLLTPMGWFKTWKLTFSREIMDVRRNRSNSDDDDDAEAIPPDVSLREAARHSGHIWFSRDENLLPVRVTISTMLGSGEAVLIRYQPGEGR